MVDIKFQKYISIAEYTSVIYNPKRTIEISEFILCIYVWSLWSARNIMQNRNKQRNKHTCIGRYCLDTSNIPPRDASVGTHLYCRFSESHRNVVRSALKANITETHINFSGKINTFLRISKYAARRCYIVSHIVTFQKTGDRAYVSSQRDNRVDSSRHDFSPKTTTTRTMTRAPSIVPMW